MRYIGVKEAATKWNISERSVRNYCTNGRIPGAVLDGKTWDIPEDAVKPQRKKRTEKIETDLLSRLRMEKESGILGGIYHNIQIELYPLYSLQDSINFVYALFQQPYFHNNLHFLVF